MSKTFLKAGIDIDNGNLGISIIQVVGSIALRDISEIETLIYDAVHNISDEGIDDVGIEEFEGYCELVVSISKVHNNITNGVDTEYHVESYFVQGLI